MPWVYILKSRRFRKTYTGSTINLDKRLEEHNEGKSYFTARYKPWDIVYREYFDKLIEARKREKYLKSAAGRKYIKKKNLIGQ